jgi:hypothetical protein
MTTDIWRPRRNVNSGSISSVGVPLLEVVRRASRGNRWRLPSSSQVFSGIFSHGFDFEH